MHPSSTACGTTYSMCVFEVIFSSLVMTDALTTREVCNPNWDSNCASLCAAFGTKKVGG